MRPCRRELVSKFLHPASRFAQPQLVVLALLRLPVVTFVCRPQSQRHNQTRCRFLLLPVHRTASNLPKRTPARSMILGTAFPIKEDFRRNSRETQETFPSGTEKPFLGAETI